jgi:Xaa-Pro aminopeptidase
MSADRISALSQALADQGVDCFLAHDPISMGYLHGFHEGAGERFMTLAVRQTGEVRMICPALSEAQAKRAGIESVASWKDGEDPLRHFEALAREWDLESAIIAVDATMPARQLLLLQSVLPAALFRNGEEYIGELMSRKSEAELAKMRKAGWIADEAFKKVAPQIRAGMTERQVSKLLSDAMTELGGTPVFAIVAAGKGSAEPHHISDDTVLRHGDVVILDFGCDYEGYKSDITRTVAIGDATEKAMQIYRTVFKAHQAARTSIKPGVPCEAIDSAARQVIEKEGYGPYFFHRLGHGIGQQVHEAPNMVSGNSQPLEAGHCFSVEPGIYLEGEFGVRIENIVACTADGHESMNEEPAANLLVLQA